MGTLRVSWGQTDENSLAGPLSVGRVRLLISGALLVLAPGVLSAAPPKKAASPVRPVPRPGAASRPVGGAISSATLGQWLKSVGYAPTPAGPFQRLRVEEAEFVYTIDIGPTPSGEWVIGAANLAPIPDLTHTPSGPLLALLTRNDREVGVYFSYNRDAGRLVLNATVPGKNLDAARLKTWVEALKKSVRETEGLWSPRHWSN